jgi:hypothetical protein
MHLAAVLMLVANRSCLPMIAPPLSEDGWLLVGFALLLPRRGRDASAVFRQLFNI